MDVRVCSACCVVDVRGSGCSRNYMRRVRHYFLMFGQSGLSIFLFFSDLANFWQVREVSFISQNFTEKYSTKRCSHLLFREFWKEWQVVLYLIISWSYNQVLDRLLVVKGRGLSSQIIWRLWCLCYATAATTVKHGRYYTCVAAAAEKYTVTKKHVHR